MLTEAEKEAFLQKIAELIDFGIIDKEVMNHIYGTLLAACGRRLYEENKGAEHEE